MAPRVSFLGPAGTFSDDALSASVGSGVERVPKGSVFAAIDAVIAQEVERALVPFENSIEGSVRSTLDALAFDAPGIVIVGAVDHPVRHSLIARGELALDEVRAVVSHPQANAQCARFIREHLPRASVRAAPSTAEAVRIVSAEPEPWAALGAASAAEIYGCVVIKEGVEDSPENVTRFAWLAPSGTPNHGDGPWTTTLVFSEPGQDRPGALVEALAEFSDREVNLTRIESRPRRTRLGSYMFFIDVEGAESEDGVREAIGALRRNAESVRILGSYTVGGPPPLP
ncbi:MAG: prephenate dehydratase [Solirubrobacterales bacterium]